MTVTITTLIKSLENVLMSASIFHSVVVLSAVMLSVMVPKYYVGNIFVTFSSKQGWEGDINKWSPVTVNRSIS